MTEGDLKLSIAGPENPPHAAEEEEKRGGFINFITNGCTNQWARLIIYCCACLLTSCIYFGWQDFSLMMMRGGAYAWKCQPGDPIDDTGFCEAQEDAVSGIYSAANGSEFAFAAVAGLLLDTIGPRWCATLGELLHLLANLLIMFSTESRQMYIAGMVFSGAAVNIVAFPALTVMEHWPRRQALAVSIIVGCQSSASIVAPILRKIWDLHPDWTYRGVWGTWLASFWLPISLLYIWSLPRKRNYTSLLGDPKKLIQQDEPGDAETRDGDIDKEVLQGVEKEGSEQGKEEVLSARALAAENSVLVLPQTKKEVWKAFLRDLLTVDIVGMALYFGLQMFQFAYYPAVVRQAVSEKISNYVGWMVPLQGPFSFLIGFAMDYTGTILTMYGMCLTLVFVSLGAGLGPQHQSLQYIVGFLFIFMQSATYNVKYTFVNEMYDPYNFGKLVGVLGLAGGTGVYLSAPLTGSDRFKLIFCVLTGVAGVMALITTFLWLRQRSGINHKTTTGVIQTHRHHSKKKAVANKELVATTEEVETTEEV